MTKLMLDRALVTFDLETTGLDIENDRIVEISCVKTERCGDRSVFTRRLNPGKPIAPEATAVHGIRDDDVRDAPGFAELAAELTAFLRGCDLSGFNVERFDLPLLAKEFERIGQKFPDSGTRIIDSWRIFLKKEPRDLTAAYRLYCGKDLEGAHSAEADAVAAADVLLAQVERYADLPKTVDALDEYCHPVHPGRIDSDGKFIWSDGIATINFGKHRGKSLEMLAAEHPDYLHWICGASFSDEVVRICSEALNGRFPVSNAKSAA
ncbi:MAG: exonuclease domain-containing protein [Myxococcota bacterium]